MGEVDRRVRDVTELPNESLSCAAAGRHIGFWTEDPALAKADGWGPLNSWEVRYRCPCGRWKKEIVDLDTGERLNRNPEYGGGVLLWLGSSPSQAEAKAEWLRRVQERRKAADAPGVTPLRRKSS